MAQEKQQSTWLTCTHALVEFGLFRFLTLLQQFLCLIFFAQHLEVTSVISLHCCRVQVSHVDCCFSWAIQEVLEQHLRLLFIPEAQFRTFLNEFMLLQGCIPVGVESLPRLDVSAELVKQNLPEVHKQVVGSRI